MEVALTRDWIIIIVGVLEVILLIGAIILLLVLYSKVKQLIEKGKETVQKIEQTISSPYLKAGAWIFKTVATVLSVFDKRKTKEV